MDSRNFTTGIAVKSARGLNDGSKMSWMPGVSDTLRVTARFQPGWRRRPAVPCVPRSSLAPPLRATADVAGSLYETFRLRAVIAAVGGYRCCGVTSAGHGASDPLHRVAFRANQRQMGNAMFDLLSASV